MKIRFLSVIVFVVSILCVSCDDTTDMIGTSLTDNSDLLEVETASFSVSSESFVADSVLSRNVTGYLGKIRDPETGNYITGNFMAQFGTLEDYTLPEKDSIVSLDKDNEVVADSCSIRLFYQSFYGDSLATMNLTAHEMSKPMEEWKWSVKLSVDLVKRPPQSFCIKNLPFYVMGRKPAISSDKEKMDWSLGTAPKNLWQRVSMPVFVDHGFLEACWFMGHV